MPTDLTHTRRKSRTLSSFLKKTYDILDVTLFSSRNQITIMLSDGLMMVLASLLSKNKNSLNKFCQGTSSTATTHHLSDKYPLKYFS